MKCWRAVGHGRFAATGELGLAVDKECALGGDLVARAEAGADDVEIVAVFVLESRAEGEGGEVKANASIAFAAGDFPCNVAHAGGEHGGLGNESEGTPGGTVGGIGGLEIGGEGGLDAGVDERAGKEVGRSGSTSMPHTEQIVLTLLATGSAAVLGVGSAAMGAGSTTGTVGVVLFTMGA